MNDLRLVFIYSPVFEQMAYPPDCPFRTERAGLTYHRLKALALMGGPNRRELAPTRASVADLQQFHSRPYLDELQRAVDGDLTMTGLRMGLGGPDTPVFRDMFEYGSWACGSALQAADLLLTGQAEVVFSLAGGFHHAKRERASGFCYLNDVVLACLRLADAHKRVAYLDLDAHHGDGVQEAFYSRRDVLTVSLHETGKQLFPWGGFEDEIGEGDGLGFNINVPLPPGVYDDAYQNAFERAVAPVLVAYAPDVLVLELGMDTLAGDPLTHLCLTNNLHVHVIRRLIELNVPILVTGGGGYNVPNTVRGWALAWHTFCQEEDPFDLSLGLGGVFLSCAEWTGGLRDRALSVTGAQRQNVESALETTIGLVQQNLFRYHGLDSRPALGCGSAIGT